MQWASLKSFALILSTLLLLPFPSWAQVYKCKDISGKFGYSDIPCDNTSQPVKTLERAEFTKAPNTSEPAAPVLADNPNSEKLDDAVKRAIASHDLRHARELALTPKHWRWIEEAIPVKTEANLRWEQLNSYECKQAQRSYDLQASSIRYDLAEIERKRQAERATCGGYIKAR